MALLYKFPVIIESLWIVPVCTAAKLAFGYKTADDDSFKLTIQKYTVFRLQEVHEVSLHSAGHL